MVDVIVVGEKSGRSRLTGNGNHLRSLSNPIMFNVSENMLNFDLNKFLKSAVWLNENLGEGNWFYDDMKYYFATEYDLVMFKLAVVYEE